MKYHVKITEEYTYERDIECDDEESLQDILREEVPLLVDMNQESIERIRARGLGLKCEYEW
jgi:hypothetical protein